MQKYLIASIIVLIALTSYLGYQNLQKNPVFEIKIHEDATLFIDNKYYELIQESTTLHNAPVGHYEIADEEFDVVQANTTVYIIY